ncbi:MAG: acyl-CoA dehydratase activase-related protein [Myxococcota bacterium]|jgi:predicted CoA-substrate-specific enzyme activase|nr:acyl-CoA dehydratase activase-related protein [Myxococcota bacterium]
MEGKQPQWEQAGSTQPERAFLGIDMGAETVKVVELLLSGSTLKRARQRSVEHHKQPDVALLQLLSELDWKAVQGAAVCGRFSRLLKLPRVPTKQAQVRAFHHLFGSEPGAVVSIGSHGFSVLQMGPGEVEQYRENARCSQGTGNFLRQLVERFDLDLAAADALCDEVLEPAPLSGRCPVILKTDMTHLANKGESRARILAGLYDAVCENVQVLVKPAVLPKRVALVGGVSRAARIRRNFEGYLRPHGIELLDCGEDALFFEALGCALSAMELEPLSPQPLEALLQPPAATELDRFPALAASLSRVKRQAKQPFRSDSTAPVLLGFDIGSTGSKVVALDLALSEPVWESYINTNGNPVLAAQTLMQHYVEQLFPRQPLAAVAVTGSGREIVGSLLSVCYGSEHSYVLNEIAAHAEGALHFDPRVDTIFEIGGQDAKYIRLSEGRVVDAAMNEACSAGTGSFVEEQGRKFSGIRNVVHLGEEALCAKGGVSLGQHCSVFMAEIIDEAVASGEDTRAIIAGIYDSVIQNYLNRVKGARSIGQVIFCQGMPFSADALAAAVARQTQCEVIIPPNPGTVGALGIALLARKDARIQLDAQLQPERFLSAEVVSKDSFVCRSTVGCGGTGNRCRIDRLGTRVEGVASRFTWGGACSLWDRGTGKQKLPDLAPDPFREREALIDALIAAMPARQAARIAVSDEFQLKSLFPFFATFLYELGFDLDVYRGSSQKALKQGIEKSNVPFCAPMQHYHGVVGKMAEAQPEFLFLPMIRSLPRMEDEPHSVLCPVVQAGPDIVRLDLKHELKSRILSPVINTGVGQLESAEFIESCQKLANELGVFTVRWVKAYQVALQAQLRFDRQCLDLGSEALDFCAREGIIPVLVLGRIYTTYNTVLNSNVPAILREQGAMAIPVDCYPIASDTPVFHDMFWGYGQRNLRAAHQIRRTPGLYSIWCSNYSCGPDSFALHFYAYQMEGKPFAVIETDGHSGDAGTKTRVEAFLHCVREDLRNPGLRPEPNCLLHIEKDKRRLPEVRRNDELVLVPRMGAGAEVMAAGMRAVGVRAEALPMPDRETVRLGRRHTSGKECVPMTITLGSLLQRLEKEPDPSKKFAFFMPTSIGPCRFGVYNLLHKIVIEKLNYRDRVRVWSPSDLDYFEGLPAGLSALIFSGFVAGDLLQAALYDVRPVETTPGATQRLFEHYFAELIALIENSNPNALTTATTLQHIATGRLFGISALLRSAAQRFAALKSPREIPTVSMVGEIYVRCDPFSNDFVIEKLESHGIRVRFAPFFEWLEYTDHVNLNVIKLDTSLSTQLASFLQRGILNRLWNCMSALDWPARTKAVDSIEASRGYLRKDLLGEAVLTLGGPLHEYRHGEIDGVISVGPLECMPSKIAEAQFHHAGQDEGILSLTLSLNGDPIDPETLDTFAYEVHARFKRRAQAPDVLESTREQSENSILFSKKLWQRR